MRGSEEQNAQAGLETVAENPTGGEMADAMSPEKMEEEKLYAKYPQAKGGVPPSQFLQKRLQQRKYFDSGDYNMAKAKGLKLGALARPPKTQKPPLSVQVDNDGQTSPTGNKIPTPETVPQRKTSIVNPAASKLSPQPIHHHPNPDDALALTPEASS